MSDTGDPVRRLKKLSQQLATAKKASEATTRQVARARKIVEDTKKAVRVLDTSAARRKPQRRRTKKR